MKVGELKLWVAEDLENYVIGHGDVSVASVRFSERIPDLTKAEARELAMLFKNAPRMLGALRKIRTELNRPGEPLVGPTLRAAIEAANLLEEIEPS